MLWTFPVGVGVSMLVWTYSIPGYLVLLCLDQKTRTTSIVVLNKDPLRGFQGRVFENV